MIKSPKYLQGILDYEIDAIYSNDLTAEAQTDKVTVFLASNYSGEEPFSTEFSTEDFNSFAELAKLLSNAVDELLEERRILETI